MNTFEDTARTRKAIALADAFMGHVEALRLAYKQSDVPAVTLAVRAPAVMWNDLADSIGVNHPSEQTVAVVIELVRMKVRVAAESPEDLFRGL